MKKVLLLVAMSALSTIVFAQQDSLLKSFKYRINKLRAVQLYANGNSQFNRTDFSNVQKSSSASGILGGSYFYTKSTDKILLTSSANFNGNFSRATSNNTQAIYRSTSFSVAPGFNILNKWFFGKNFFEVGTEASGNFYKYRSSNLTLPNPSISRQGQYSTALTVGIGKGRLEDVTDMQNALWLYKEFGNEHQLSGVLSAQELIGLGQAITKGKNTRVLDSRISTKFLLATVDHYLQQKGAIKKSDIDYFSNLNDILFFAFNNTRLSGTELFLRATPSIAGQQNDNKQSDGITENKEKLNDQTFTISTGFQKYIPTNLIHQNNFGASVKLAIFKNKNLNQAFINNVISTETNTNQQVKQAALILFYQHAIYPNTRTNITFNFQPEVGYRELDSDKRGYQKVDLSASLNYFISYNTRFTCGLNANYQKNEFRVLNSPSNLSNAFQLSANFGLSVNL